MALKIHLRDKGKMLASNGPVVYALRNHEATPSDSSDSDVSHAVTLVAELLTRHPTIAMLMVVEHGTAKPGPEERRQMQAALDSWGDRLVMGYAFCGLGFWAGALRTVLLGISRLAGSSVIAHGTVEATARNLAVELIGLDPEQMTRDAELLRAELASELPARLASG